jgi:hypothetical protein
MIGFDWGRATASNLLLRGINIRFKGYKGLDHEIGDGEVRQSR